VLLDDLFDLLLLKVLKLVFFEMQFSTTTERGVGSIKGDGRSTAVGSLLLNKSETTFTIRGIQVEPPTKTISWTFDLSILKSRTTFSAGSGALKKRSWYSSSKWARVREV
jgi:hypothetical protein